MRTATLRREYTSHRWVLDIGTHKFQWLLAVRFGLRPF
jgi:hypothetical protein